MGKIKYMSQRKIKVLNLVGMGHSGSTLIGNILSQLDGFFAVGEFHNVWKGIIDREKCGCGVEYRDCETWNAIFERAFGGFDQVDAAGIHARYYEARKKRGDFRGTTLRRDRVEPSFDEFYSAVTALFRAIRDVTGDHVIVDTSRYLSYAYLMPQQPDIDIYVAHLVRDPRGALFSFIRKRSDRPWYPLNLAAQWMVRTLGAEYLWRNKNYLRIRYEDFVTVPQRTVNQVLRLIGESETSLPFDEDGSLCLEKVHTVAGNRRRFSYGELKLRLDEKWIPEMRPRDKALVTCLTSPFLVRYGYKLFPKA